jgi:hypothetical protein
VQRLFSPNKRTQKAMTKDPMKVYIANSKYVKGSDGESNAGRPGNGEWMLSAHSTPFPASRMGLSASSLRPHFGTQDNLLAEKNNAE